MLDVEDFSAVFRGLNYSPGLVSEIQEYRTALGGRTYFERLLELLKIKGGRKLYPPQSPQQLSDLHTRILSAPTTLHNKHCLLFYLLKDLSPSYHEPTELSALFAKSVHLEKRFWTFIEGLWALDHLQYSTAVSHLTHPSIIPTFPDEIMHTLLSGRERLGAAQQKGGSEDILPLAYFECVKPPLDDANVRREWARYLAERNVTECYMWVHSRPQYEQEGLLEVLVQATLELDVWAGEAEGDGYKREVRAGEFVALPFTKREEVWLERFLTEGKGRSFQGAMDTVLMRRVARGELAGLVAENGARGRRVDGVNWDMLKEGVKRGLGPRMGEEGFVV